MVVEYRVFSTRNHRPCGDYSFTTERTLSGNGANLSGVLFNLCREHERPSARCFRFVQALPEQDIESELISSRHRAARRWSTLTETFGGRKTKIRRNPVV